MLNTFLLFLDVFGPFSHGFGLFSDGFRPFSDHFEPFSGRVPAVSDDSNPNLKIFKFQLARAGPVRAVPSVRAVPPSPGQLKFEILRKNPKKTERNENETKNGVLNSHSYRDVVNDKQSTFSFTLVGTASLDRQRR